MKKTGLFRTIACLVAFAFTIGAMPVEAAKSKKAKKAKTTKVEKAPKPAKNWPSKAPKQT